MVYRHRLNNGVRIVGEEISSVRSVSIGVWIGTGSRYETPDNNGISHFLEHMLFKGTESHSARELANAFDSIGGQVNAFTAKEYTCFYAKVLDEHFSTALDTLSDMMFHSTFAPEEMEKEKKVVIEEIRMYEDTPDELVMDLLAENVYVDHPLGYTILGQEGNLKSFARSDVLQYVDERYRAENVVVAVAGNVAEDDVVTLVEQYFGTTFANSDVAPGLLGTRTPGFQIGVNARFKDTEQVHLSLATEGIPAGDPRLYSLILLNNALGSAPSSRLFQEIREERGLAYSVFSFHSAYRDCGMFGIYAGTSPSQVDTVLSLIQETCEDIKVNGITDEEFRKGKEQVKGSMMLSLESTSSRMNRLAKNELILGHDVSLDETLAGINRVTNDDVKAVAQSLFAERFAIAAVGPVKDLDFTKWQ